MKLSCYVKALVCVLLTSSSSTFAQISISPNGSPPAGSAMLDVQATDKGMLVPRMTQSERDAINNPDEGLLLFNLDCGIFNYFYNGTWRAMPEAIIPIIAQPSAGSSCDGGSVSFSITASGNGLTYQWQEYDGNSWTDLSDGGIYSGTQTPAITINPVSPSEDGLQYRCTVSGSCNAAAISNPASLVVNSTPAQPDAISGGDSYNINTTGIAYSINPMPGASTYTWTAPSGATVTSGSGTPSITIDFGNTSGDICVTASNECGISSPSCLTVTLITPWSCGTTLSIDHVENAVAPVSGTIEYGTVLTNLSGASKCWITRNLGATAQASSAGDASATPRGWWWKFNRKRGYLNDGSPVPAWDNGSVNENSNWLPGEDPCALELGSGWRIPTNTEWNSVITNGALTNSANAFSSVLKLHAAGFMDQSGGAPWFTGGYGVFWSSVQGSNTTAGTMVIHGSGAVVNTGDDKSRGFSVRCIKD